MHRAGKNPITAQTTKVDAQLGLKGFRDSWRVADLQSRWDLKRQVLMAAKDGSGGGSNSSNMRDIPISKQLMQANSISLSQSSIPGLCQMMLHTLWGGLPPEEILPGHALTDPHRGCLLVDSRFNQTDSPEQPSPACTHMHTHTIDSMSHTHLSSWKTEAGRLGVPNQLELQSETTISNKILISEN